MKNSDGYNGCYLQRVISCGRPIYGVGVWGGVCVGEWVGGEGGPVSNAKGRAFTLSNHRLLKNRPLVEGFSHRSFKPRHPNYKRKHIVSYAMNYI